MMKRIDERRTEPFYRAHPTYIDDAGDDERRRRLPHIPDAGHFPWIEQPETFDAVCDKWFGTLDA